MHEDSPPPSIMVGEQTWPWARLQTYAQQEGLGGVGQTAGPGEHVVVAANTDVMLAARVARMMVKRIVMEYGGMRCTVALRKLGVSYFLVEVVDETGWRDEEYGMVYIAVASSKQHFL